MDTLPVELLEQITSRLDVSDIWNLRLINSVWHTLITERLRRSSDINFKIKNLDQLIEFNRLIPPGTFLPTQNFEFCYGVMSTRSSTLHVQEFASKFGHSVNVLLFDLIPETFEEFSDTLFPPSASLSSSSEDEPYQGVSGTISTSSEVGPCQPESRTLSTSSEVGPCQPESRTLSTSSDVGPCQPESRTLSTSSEVGLCQPESSALSTSSEVGPCQPESGAVSTISEVGPCQPESGAVSTISEVGPCQPESGIFSVSTELEVLNLQKVSSQAESGAVLPKSFRTAEDYINSNISILLNSTVSNLQKLLISPVFAVGHIDDLPSTFPVLCDISVQYFEPPQLENTSLPLLDQIVSRVPNIRIFSFVNHGRGDCLNNLPSILENLSKMNDNVEVKLDLELKPSDTSHFSKLLKRPSPKVVWLILEISNTFDLETSPTLTRRLTEWIQLHANHLRVLTLKEQRTVVSTIFEDLVINLPHMIALEELDILQIRHREGNERTNFRVLPKEFPKLRILKMPSGIANLFNGVFPNVAELHLPYGDDDIDFETKLQSTFPNVKILLVASIRLAFKFFKLRTLMVHVRIKPDVNYWNLLTGGVARVPDTEICTVEASEEPGTSLEKANDLGNYEQMKTFPFKDLQDLETVYFDLNFSNLDFVAALVYVSRTKKLRRLRNLVLQYPENHQIPIEFQDELKRHHEKFEIIAVG